MYLNLFKKLGAKAVLVLIFALIGFSFFMQAQNVPYRDISIASPNAGALGKYGDIPVSFHTGVPQIHIPIYTVNEGSLQLPISLNYHAGGIKVMEPASWVGAGWSMDAGGVVTRSVRGAPDERLTSNAGFGYFSDNGYSNYYTTGGGQSPTTSGLVPADYQFATGSRDGEPDLFFFNFGGYSGKFYFRDDRTPIIEGGEDLKIQYYYPADNTASTTPGDANIQGFIITTPKGDKYYFGKYAGWSTSGAAPVEFSFPYSATHQSPTDAVISSWFLSKIVSADEQFTITLEYQGEAYSYFTISTYPIDHNLSASAGSPGTYKYSYALVKDFIQGVRLSRISFSNGVVNFIPGNDPRTDLSSYENYNFTDNVNTQAKPLASISINDNGRFCKKYNFFYSYFSDNLNTQLPGYLSNYSITTDQQRLKLDSIKEQSCDAQIVNPPHVFSYYSNFLPRRLSFAQDHWGYYNGVSTNADLIPTYTINTYDFSLGADRDSRWPEMENGTLTEIKYPMGGSSVFEFEPNTTWVNATVYNPIYRNTYSVGYDGGGSYDINNVSFTTNHYNVTLANNSCPSNTPGCSAYVSVLSLDGNTEYGRISAPGGQTVKGFILVPSAGSYKIHMFRSATQTGTGATAVFYEIVPSFIQNNKIIGGLRIKSLTNKSGTTSADETTSYSYDVAGQSSGILYSRPSYVQVLRNDIVALHGFVGTTSTTNPNPHGCMAPEMTPAVNQPYLISPGGIVAMSTSQGNHVGYNEVRVTQAGNGYSIYRYYGSDLWDLNHDDVAYRNVTPLVCDFNIPNYPAAPLPFEYKRGMLKYEGHFNETGHRLREIQYYYDFDSSNIETPGYKTDQPLGALLGTFYWLRSYWKSRTQQIEINAGPDGSVIQTSKTFYYESPYHHQVTRVVTGNSKNELIETRIKYASDFSLPDCDAITDCRQSYVSGCASCYATLQSQLAGCTSQNCAYWANVDYYICREAQRKSFVNCRKTNFTNPSSLYNTVHQNKKLAADDNLKPVLELQDEYIAAPIEVAKWKAGQLISASFNKYGYTDLPSKVFPSELHEIKLAAPSSSFTVAANTNSTLSRDSRYEKEAAVKFLNAKLVEVAARVDVQTSYVWDNTKNFPVVKAVGIDQATLSAAYNAVNGNPALLRSQASLAKALITTYTYSPLQGITSETDPNNRSTYYEYDKLGRLSLVRDQDGKIVKKYEYKYAGQ